MKLLKKEFRLCLHPAALMMLALSALILIPNYPYGVSFFYMTLGIFFVCLSGRENHDAAFTLGLPVSRRGLVRGRVLFASCLELMQLLACAVFCCIHARLLGNTPNEAGLDANIALFGEGFLLFGAFNAIFFPGYYRDVNRVGGPFIRSSVAIFLLITAEIVCTHAVPWVRDALDTPDPMYMEEKLGFLAFGAAVYAGLTALAIRVSARRFEALDLQL